MADIRKFLIINDVVKEAAENIMYWKKKIKQR